MTRHEIIDHLVLLVLRAFAEEHPLVGWYDVSLDYRHNFALAFISAHINHSRL